MRILYFKKHQIYSRNYLNHFEYIIIIVKRKKMVLLHYKKTDHNQFLYEVSGVSLVSDVIDALV